MFDDVLGYVKDYLPTVMVVMTAMTALAAAIAPLTKSDKDDKVVTVLRWLQDKLAFFSLSKAAVPVTRANSVRYRSARKR